MKAKAEVMGRWGNRGLLELWVSRTQNRVQRVRRLVGNVLLGNSREELSHRNSEGLTTAIEDNWDGQFLKLLWRHLVLELCPLSVGPVCPTFFWDPGERWPNLMSAVCWCLHTRPQLPKQAFLLFLFHLPALNTDPESPGRHPEKCSFQAAGPWKSRNRRERKALRCQQTIQSPSWKQWELLVHFKDRMK